MGQSNTSFFFYDLETSGISPKTSRIMQFAGQRTDMELNPIGEPYNILIKLTDDILPDPGAIVVTGITPQMTIADGITEAEFFKIFTEEIALPGTIFVGFNNIRFDDEFIRYGLYRNFYDPYEWQWKDGRSRWDILDLTRITRALRPDGIDWPFASDGKATNRLEYLSSVNKLDHANAHDALSDVLATIDVARLIKTKQPKLFDYSFSMRTKQAVEDFLTKHKEFVYVSGKYSSENEKLAVAYNLGAHPVNNGSFLIYNLISDPIDFVSMSGAELADRMEFVKDRPVDDRLPVKILKSNKCPAIAPMSVLTKLDMERLLVDPALVSEHRAIIDSSPGFYMKICEAIKILESKAQNQSLHLDPVSVDGQLYDRFIDDSDKKIFDKVRSADSQKAIKIRFKDSRMNLLLPLYKARNYPKLLNAEERADWEKHKTSVYLRDLPKFAVNFEQTFSRPGLSDNDKYVLEELKLYVESLIPAELYN